MTRRTSWTRPPRAILGTLFALLVLVVAPDGRVGAGISGVAAQGQDSVKCADRCATLGDACKARNRQGFDDCRKFNKCSKDSKLCDEECRHACAMCKSFWGYYVNNACDAGLVSCLSTCK